MSEELSVKQVVAQGTAMALGRVEVESGGPFMSVATVSMNTK
ncbi:hypothetical protein SAMN04490239_6897 [Rhodococcus koreensis]|jgi:hypothetical protein|uniref:Uncharacterized protein n=2 Tax=Rhodococcus TaxID=1827 RepID=A0A1H4Y501_9NOCA|nr:MULTISPECIES: hypothetical protein [Rhodococcus]GCE41912.1 hypothetical protein Rhow_005571 [Rhodococcus wratislaviensis]SED12064.1 hypothetical protein SAMN04490239_6897 [Rhodococcus koreensis]